MMLVSRASVLSAILLSLGGVVAIANPYNPNPLAPQLAQTFEVLEGRQRLARDKQGLMQQLNLTSAQIQQMQTIHSEYRTRIIQHEQTLSQATQQLKQLMAGTASNNEIRTQHQEVQQLRQQLEQVRFESVLAMRNVLTPQQRSEFVTLMEQRRENFPPSSQE